MLQRRLQSSRSASLVSCCSITRFKLWTSVLRDSISEVFPRISVRSSLASRHWVLKDDMVCSIVERRSRMSASSDRIVAWPDWSDANISSTLGPGSSSISPQTSSLQTQRQSYAINKHVCGHGTINKVKSSLLNYEKVTCVRNRKRLVSDMMSPALPCPLVKKHCHRSFKAWISDVVPCVCSRDDTTCVHEVFMEGWMGTTMKSGC